MIDPLFERCQLAIAESHLLRQQHRMLRQQFETSRDRLRLTVLESAMDRSERKAVLDEKG
jgi:hypothetical protein